MLITTRMMVSQFCTQPMAVGNHATTPVHKFPSIKHLSEKVAVSTCVQHLIVKSFGTHVDGDATVVDAAAER